MINSHSSYVRTRGFSLCCHAPSGIAKVAKKYDKTVIAFSGSVSHDARECNNYGIDAFFPVIRRICTLEEAMDKTVATGNLSDTAEQVFRMIKAVEDYY